VSPWRGDDGSEDLLAGLRIVDLADEKGELCGRILADLGADVIRVEPPGGARSRLLPPFHQGHSLFFAARNANKRGVAVDLDDSAGRERLVRLVESADVLIETTPPGFLAERGLGPDRLLERNPGLVVTSITDFGQTGPYREWRANEWVQLAMSGVLSRSGLGARDPLVPPGQMMIDSTAIQAAWATLVAYWNRLSTGRGDHVDVSIAEASLQVMDPAVGSASVSPVAALVPTRDRPVSAIFPSFRCADGHIRLLVLAPRQWRSVFSWIGEPEEFSDPAFEHFPKRMESVDALHAVYDAFFRDRSKVEVSEEGQERGVAIAPVLTVADALRTPHFETRGVFVDDEVAPGVCARMPRGFVEVDGRRAGFRHRAPSLGEHDVLLDAPAVPRPPTVGVPRGASVRPLAGIRIVDFGSVVIGNELGRLFADQGAEVIKVENRAFPDIWRTALGKEMTPGFAATGRNKQSFGVNLRTPEGNAIMKRLVATADVVLENFKPGTLENLGLGVEVLREVRPDLIMLSTNANGSTGPWSSWLGYGPLVRCTSGITSMWRYPDDESGFGEPTTAYPDHMGARVCATAVCAALLRRQRTGQGAVIEAAQVEMIIAQLSDIYLATSLGHDSVSSPYGNHSDLGAPWGVYPCAGDDEWCVITVSDDADWSNLCSVMGSPEWVCSSDYGTGELRIANRDALDAHIVGWTSTQEPRSLMERLQAAGVAAAWMMRPPDDHAVDPHFAERGFYRTLDQPGLGPILMEDGPFRSTETPSVPVDPAPLHGQHTREICIRLLGMADDEIAALVEAGVLEEPTPDELATLTA
jgi:crotonobetainyl-CoA:carnitine CoA-transferase CaiB-like acyl-CoA transferase